MKKMLLAALISFPIFLAFFFGMDYLASHPPQRSTRQPSKAVPPAVDNAIERAWKDFKKQWEEEHDGRPAILPPPTPYPPLADIDREARIRELFQTNGGCRFPCWWGIIPGQTSWEAAHASLTPLLESDVNQYRADKTHEIYTDAYYYHSFDIILHTTNESPVPALLVTDIPPEYLSSLNIRQIFRRYGKPDEIYIRSPHSDRGDRSCTGEFELFLYYPAEQFAVRYRYLWYPMYRPIRVCDLDRPALAEFYMWDPAIEYGSFHDAIKYNDWYTKETMLPLEEATRWTTESFYKAFPLQEGAAFCLDAPSYNWNYLPGSSAGRIPYWCNESTPTPIK